ncbi:MAG: NADH-quinone oxidoreductase subunit L [Sporichthyaceae bacterium]|nr:NADH-quinone oxidoreductase subunit L [Sporichthyaceae bacterium]
MTTAASGAAQTSAWLLIALPLLGATVLLLGGRRTDRWGHWLGVATALASFACAVALFVSLLGLPADGRSRSLHLFDWIQVGSLNVNLGLLLDPLSVSFALLITGVGSLIHIYSVGYMSHDPHRRRFFAYLNLFLAAMLLLVLADNFLTLYVGWEGVGLASYLLIGFWHYKPPAAAAAKKAFVVNRVGDFGLAIAIFLMFKTFGALDFATVFGSAEGAGRTTLTVIGLLLLLGACGKSAQVPLQSWLLDAMEGPTPVSALIHAATMVTAGVYLIVRANPIFNLAPDAQTAVLVVGAVTLLAGAIIGCAKDDIKKALAASTMSQIGYMVLAAGLGPAGYAFAIMHLLTHGFFKAGLFLGAGSVMHGMNDEVDMRRYGGLARVMPITAITFGLGYLAILGVPPFSGFFSKDKIIEAAFNAGGSRGWILGGAALLGAGITAFYMSRVMLMTFFGQRRWAPDAHPHESPSSMTAPMVLLAIGSIGAGAFLAVGDRFARWLEPVVGEHHVGEHVLTPTTVTAMTLSVVAIGLLFAWFQYGRQPVPQVSPIGSPFTRAARRDLYGDAFNEATFMRPGQYLTRLLVFLDNRGVDGLVNGLAALIGGSSGRLRRLQTGFVRSYALSMFGGAALVAVALLLVRL